jgi:biotin carboxyl carrier protein
LKIKLNKQNDEWLFIYIFANMFTAKTKNSTFKVSFSDKNLSSGSINDKPFDLDILFDDKGRMSIIKNNKSYQAEIVKFIEEDKIVTVKVNGQVIDVQLKDKFDELLSKMGLEGLSAKKLKDFKAPMPGLVLDLPISIGQEVKKGDILMVLEAMKMENMLKSPGDGVISKVLVNKGQAVEKGQVLINFE